MNVEQRFAIRGVVSEDDFVAAQRMAAGRVAGCMFPAIVFVFAASMTALCIYVASWETWPILLLTFGITTGYLYSRGSLRRTYRRERHLFRSSEGELTPEHLHLRSDFGEAKLPWWTFKRSQSSSQLLLLYHSASHFTIIPRSHFEDQTQFDAARDSVRVWICTARDEQRAAQRAGAGGSDR